MTIIRAFITALATLAVIGVLAALLIAAVS